MSQLAQSALVQPTVPQPASQRQNRVQGQWRRKGDDGLLFGFEGRVRAGSAWQSRDGWLHLHAAPANADCRVSQAGRGLRRGASPKTTTFRTGLDFSRTVIPASNPHAPCVSCWKKRLMRSSSAIEEDGDGCGAAGSVAGSSAAAGRGGWVRAGGEQRAVVSVKHLRDGGGRRLRHAPWPASVARAWTPQCMPPQAAPPAGCLPSRVVSMGGLAGCCSATVLLSVGAGFWLLAPSAPVSAGALVPASSSIGLLSIARGAAPRAARAEGGGRDL